MSISRRRRSSAGPVVFPSFRSEGAVYVACSTSCFAKYPLEHALRVIAELEFGKVDVAIRESGPHLKPSEVIQDVHLAAQHLRIGPGLTAGAFSVEIDTKSEEMYIAQFRALCRLARLSTVPLIAISAAGAGTGLDAEVVRLTRLARIAEKDGIVLAVATHIGTLMESPDTAVEICQRIPGLGLTLD